MHVLEQELMDLDYRYMYSECIVGIDLLSAGALTLTQSQPSASNPHKGSRFSHSEPAAPCVDERARVCRTPRPAVKPMP